MHYELTPKLRPSHSDSCDSVVINQGIILTQKHLFCPQLNKTSCSQRKMMSPECCGRVHHM